MVKLLYEKESYIIRGACFFVWKKFGGAFKEKIIEEALAIEIEKRGLKIERQKRIIVYYDEKYKLGTYLIDQVVNGKIIIEIKVKPFLNREDERQFWLYLKGSKYKLGFLVNFGNKLEIRRRIYDKARRKIPHFSASLSA